MTLKIETTVNSQFILCTLSGRIEAQHLGELQRLLSLHASHSVVLDLKEIRLVDRGAIRFLASCKAQGAKLENCPAFITEWIAREKE